MPLSNNLDQEIRAIAKTRTVGRAKELMRSRPGLWLIGVLSFLESALPLPIITDPFMVAAMLLNRQRIFLIALITTLSSVLGGVVAFFTAVLFLELIIPFLSPEVQEVFNSLSSGEAGTFLITLIGAVTPIPYTATAYVVAAVNGSLLLFIVVSVLGRGFRYGLIGLLVHWFGPVAVDYAKRSIGVTSLIIFMAACLVWWLKM